MPKDTFYLFTILSQRTTKFWEQKNKINMLKILQFFSSLLQITTRTVFSYNIGFPGSSVGKESACNWGDLGSFPGLGRSPGEGHGNPLQYSCLENPHGQRGLTGYSP